MLPGIRVRVLLLKLVMAGLNVAVTPVGRPDAISATLSVKPFVPATLIALFALAPPTSSVRLVADDERLKPGTGMVNAMVVELLALPDVPVTVIGYVPGIAVLLALKVRFVVLELTVANAVVTPAGTPDEVRLTPLTRPIGLVTEIATGRFQAFSPTRSEKLLAEAERLKLGAGLATRGVIEAAANARASQTTVKDLNQRGF